MIVLLVMLALQVLPLMPATPASPETLAMPLTLLTLALLVKSTIDRKNAMTTQIDRTALSRVIAVINGKGGVLKTTLTANIGGMLAASGARVLLVDLDPQGNLAEDLGYTGDDRDDQGASLASALSGFTHAAKPIHQIRHNLDVFAGGAALDKATAILSAESRKDPDDAKLRLAAILSPIADDYDMILLDCPPGDEQLQTVAVAAARWALVPVKSDKSSRKGLEAVAARIGGILDLNPTIDLLGVVLVGVGTSAHVVQREAREQIAALFGADETVVFDATVRHSEATAQATRERGLLVSELDAQNAAAPKWYERIGQNPVDGPAAGPKTATSVADDLQAVTEEVVARISRAESGA